MDVFESHATGPLSLIRAFVPHQGFCPSSCLKVRANLLLCAPQVLCASNDAHDQVEPILPPEGVPVGEKISFEG